MSNTTTCSSTQIQAAINAYNAENDFYLETLLSLCLSAIFLTLFVWQVYRVGKDISKLISGKKGFVRWKIIYACILLASFLGFVRCLIRGSLWDRSAVGVPVANLIWGVFVNISYIFIFISFALIISIWSNVVCTNIKLGMTIDDRLFNAFQYGTPIAFTVPVTITMIGGTIWRLVESLISITGGRTTSNLVTLKIWCGIIMGWSIIMMIYCIITGLFLVGFIVKMKRKDIVNDALRILGSRTFGICFALLTKSIAFGVQIFLSVVISRWVVYLFVFGPEVVTLFWMGEVVYSTGKKPKKTT